MNKKIKTQKTQMSLLQYRKKTGNGNIFYFFIVILAKFIHSLENNYVDKFLLKLEVLCLLSMSVLPYPKFCK